MYPPLSIILLNSPGSDGLWSVESYTTLEVASICSDPCCTSFTMIDAYAWITESEGCSEIDAIALLSPTLRI